MRQGAGGTPGGFGSFFSGAILTAGGCYWLSQQVTIGSGPFGAYGLRPALLPLLMGTGFLFFDGTSRAGWILTACATGIVLAGMLLNLRVYFEPTRLLDTLVLLVMLAGGLGLLARSPKPQPPPQAP